MTPAQRRRQSGLAAVAKPEGHPFEKGSLIATLDNNLELWVKETTPRLLERGVYEIAAYDRAEESVVGWLDVLYEHVDRLGLGCLNDVKAFAKVYSLSDTRALRVAFSDTMRDYRNKGLGLALYLAAAALARKLGVALVADVCSGGGTSAAARRVWNSKRFRELVDIGESSLVGVYKG